jgi:hypothetical protein
MLKINRLKMKRYGSRVALQPGNKNPRHFIDPNYFFNTHITKMQIITKVKNEFVNEMENTVRIFKLLPIVLSRLFGL